MREILFRGKRVDNGELVYGDFVSKKYILQGYRVEFGYVVPYNCFEVIPETVGQYTGLTDKNGKKIFEGDIIEVGDGENAQRVRVFFEDGQFVVSHYALKLLRDRTLYSEVIGNIHDNPELMEKKK